MSDPTPLMKQYLEIKNQHPDAILFFRVGDFYEMFYEDAQIASKILEIALTSRDKNKEEAVPLCGVPYHAASTYIAKLIRAGWKVAVCEQMEDPKQARLQSGPGIVKREVIRVITPGTVIEPDLLESREPLYIAAIYLADSKRTHPTSPDFISKVIGLAYLDLSTGEFRVTALHDPSRLNHELACINPKELLLPQRMKDLADHLLGTQDQTWPIQYLPDWHFAPDLAEQLLLRHFRAQSLDGYGINGKPAVVAAAGALIRYVTDNQKGSVQNITSLKWHSLENYMILDPVTQRNLDLVHSTTEKTKDTTLLAVLDRTQTPMGARLLREWLLRPLLDLCEIEKRLATVEVFVEDYSTRVELFSKLSQVYDLERLIGRISLGAANARDLVMLKKSLKGLPEIQKLFCACQAPIIQEMLPHWDDLQDIFRMIDQMIIEEPPAQLHEGGFIKDGIHPPLDELRSIARDGKGWIAKLEAQERKRTGIDSLKVRYNQVFGYYIEITRANLHLAPQDYIRKQTLVNAERYITPELKTL
ncbi:MAG: DNA mismatch repair protein MutS, partial [Nitrospira sp.]|nr:DNA mismatch repair protein MutS [Nitrospira sp.]